MNLKQVFMAIALTMGYAFTTKAVTYTTVSDGNWNDPATWDANGTPGNYWGAGDQVIVHHDVNLDISFGYAGSLSLSASSSLKGNKNVALYNGASIVANGVLDIANFTLNSSSSANVSEKLTVTQLTVGFSSTLTAMDSLIINGKFTNNGGIVVTDSFLSISGNLENNNGSLTFNEKVDLGGNFDNNNSSAVININDSMLVSGYVKNNSSGSINIATTGYLGITGNFTNNSGGDISSSGRVETGGNFQNNGGTVESGGVFTVDGNFTQNGGSFTNNGISIVNGDFRINGTGTVNGDGIIRTNSITNYGTLAGNNDVCGLDDATATTQAGSGSYSGTTTYCEESASAALPIVLVSFEVSWKEGTFYAKWITASEINNHYFEVEYSKDGKEFYPVLKRYGAGNSFKHLRYTEKRKLTSLQAKGYYRLKQTDFDGKYSYSELRYLNVQEEIEKDPLKLKVYPNPLNGQHLYVEYSAEAVEEVVCTLYNTKGMKVLEVLQSPHETFGETARIDLLKGKTLSTGWYLLIVKTGRTIEQRKLLVP
jgi:formylmethanofuran dehydrogenase subunit C